MTTAIRYAATAVTAPISRPTLGLHDGGTKMTRAKAEELAARLNADGTDPSAYVAKQQSCGGWYVYCYDETGYRMGVL